MVANDPMAQATTTWWWFLHVLWRCLKIAVCLCTVCSTAWLVFLSVYSFSHCFMLGYRWLVGWDGLGQQCPCTCTTTCFPLTYIFLPSEDFSRTSTSPAACSVIYFSCCCAEKSWHFHLLCLWRELLLELNLPDNQTKSYVHIQYKHIYVYICIYVCVHL